MINLKQRKQFLIYFCRSCHSSTFIVLCVCSPIYCQRHFDYVAAVQVILYVSGFVSDVSLLRFYAKVIIKVKILHCSKLTVGGQVRRFMQPISAILHRLAVTSFTTLSSTTIHSPNLRHIGRCCLKVVVLYNFYLRSEFFF